MDLRDGFIGKESMSHGHIFGNFASEKIFENKMVIDVGAAMAVLEELLCHYVINIMAGIYRVAISVYFKS